MIGIVVFPPGELQDSALGGEAGPVPALGIPGEAHASDRRGGPPADGASTRRELPTRGNAPR